jgi:L-lactate utilization protein LutB
MDDNVKNVLLKRIQKVGKALESNNMAFYFAEDKAQAKDIVESLLTENETIATGGSVTLEECGIMSLLRSGKYNFIDRDTYPAEQKAEAYQKAFGADSYLCSANAITENGELYNVDGNGNRVACIVYGPKQVIAVVGCNKIVKDIPSAIERVKRISAPINTARLHCDTYCSKVGECVSMSKSNPSMAEGCDSDSRICCSYLVSARQRKKDRIKVIIVAEDLGY